jgi:hypothetical protein
MGVQIQGDTGNVIATKGTYSGNVTIGGTLTYEDVTNIDSVGLITARQGIEIGASPGVAASISVDGNMIVSGISTFGGDVQVPDKIIHSGDTNTAIRFPAADTVSVETGGSERARFDSSGRLLIGTTTEGYSGADELTVATSGDGGITIRTGTSNGGILAFSDGTSGADEYRGYVQYQHQNDALAFGSNGAQKLTLESAGNFKIEENLKVVGVCTAASFESATFSKTPTNTPAFHAYYSGDSSPSLSNNTWTKVTLLTTETLDTDSAYDGSKFTVPSGKGGYYQVAASINLYADNNDMKNARIAIYKNGSVAIQSYNLINNYASGIRHYSVSQSGVLNLSASDYIEVYVNTTTNSGSSSYISNDANGVRGNFFSAFKLII